MKDRDMKNKYADGHVFIFPARTSEVEGKRIFYIFSVRQVVEVLNQANALPVPFSPMYTEGVTRWRSRILAVLSLEHCLGMAVSEEQTHLRSVVIRSVSVDNMDNFHEVYTVCKVGGAIRQMDLPLPCMPTSVPDWITNASVLSGVYELEDHLFLVLNMEAILNAKMPREQYVS